jgi:excisionase family DNA binding protein
MVNEFIIQLRKNEERLRNIENLLNLSKTVLTLDDLCLLTGLSKSHLYKLTCWGKIPYYKTNQGKRLYFDRSEIENWMKSTRFKTVDQIEKDVANDLLLHKRGGRK